MKYWSNAIRLCAVFAVLASVAQAEPIIRLRFVEDAAQARIEVDTAFTASSGDLRVDVPPGAYLLRPLDTQPEQRRTHLFAKSFPPSQPEAMQAYLDEWRTRGYTPEVVTVGIRHELIGAPPLDNRVHWISLAQTPAAEAAHMKARLEQEGVNIWMHEETIAPGTGTLLLRAEDGTNLSLPMPVTLSAAEPLRVQGVDTGFWKENKKPIAAPGNLRIGVGPAGRLVIDEHIGLEEYLRGVLPAEMPARWHPEALKAQAICARSEILAGLGGRLALLGYDAAVTEQSRAYAGAEGRQPETDEAVRATAGEILIKNGRIVTTVFSANCGGHTEDNDTVWSGPPDDALRGVSDRNNRAASADVRDRLRNPGQTYCSRDAESTRWKRVYTEPELRAMISSERNIGRIQAIEMGDRGASGRLKWVTVSGTDGKLTIGKDLPIRRAFGSLPSSLFVVERHGSGANATFTFEGLGRGHGVGLCQQGAQGRAEAGQPYRAIVTHYFDGADIQKVN